MKRYLSIIVVESVSWPLGKTIFNEELTRLVAAGTGPNTKTIVNVRQSPQLRAYTQSVEKTEREKVGSYQGHGMAYLPKECT